MMQKYKNLYLFLLVGFIVSSASLYAIAEEKGQGWGIDDEYNQYYDLEEVDQIKVRVIKIMEITPMEGMETGVGMVVEDIRDKEQYTVHICPVSYKSMKAIPFKKGEKLKLRGSFTVINDQDVIMAAKIKGKSKTLKVRLTSVGKPFWTMDPAELMKELSDS